MVIKKILNNKKLQNLNLLSEYRIKIPRHIKIKKLIKKQIWINSSNRKIRPSHLKVEKPRIQQLVPRY